MLRPWRLPNSIEYGLNPLMRSSSTLKSASYFATGRPGRGTLSNEDNSSVCLTNERQQTSIVDISHPIILSRVVPGLNDRPEGTKPHPNLICEQ